MAREPIPAWFFAVAIVRDGPRYLLVEETDGTGWYLPGGRAERGETLADAAIRETREEAGIDVTLKGVLRVQHTPLRDGTARCRVIFMADPSGDVTPKSIADEHSLAAGWFTLDQTRGLRMRAADLLELLALADGEQPAPLSILDPQRW